MSCFIFRTTIYIVYMWNECCFTTTTQSNSTYQALSFQVKTEIVSRYPWISPSICQAHPSLAWSRSVYPEVHTQRRKPTFPQRFYSFQTPVVVSLFIEESGPRNHMIIVEHKRRKISFQSLSPKVLSSKFQPKCLLGSQSLCQPATSFWDRYRCWSYQSTSPGLMLGQPCLRCSRQLLSSPALF